MSLRRVTSIMEAAGLVDATWFTSWARDRGSAVHRAAQYLDEGDLDWSTVDPIVLPRLRQYQRFKDEVRPAILAVEFEVRNEALSYVGHPDRLVVIGGREGILDLKAPGRYPWHGVQVAMYAACIPRPLARWTLHLDDERYVLVEHRGRLDWEVAKAAITIANWRREMQ